MRKNNSVFARAVKTVFKVGVICAYVALIAILVVQALTPGDKSSAVSNNVGDKINEIVTDIKEPLKEEVAVSGVELLSISVFGQTLKGDDITVSVGSSGKINGRVLPVDASNGALSYASSNADIVAVYTDGRIKALAEGSATVTISSKQSPNLTASVNLSVIAVPVREIMISTKSAEINVGQSRKLELRYTPENTSQREVVWRSSDADVLSVGKMGVIKAIKPGHATVTATSKDSSEITSAVTIEVLPKVEAPIIEVTSIKVQAESNTGYVGKTQSLTAVTQPAGSHDSVIWCTSDESVATVSQSGTVKFLKAGSVVITAKCSSYDYCDSVTITVEEVLSQTIAFKAENLTDAGDSSFTIEQGKSGKISAILDADSTVWEVNYTSSNKDVAVVNADGTIQALKRGTAVITATTSYGGRTTSATLTITVNPVTFADTVKNFYYVVRKAFGHFGAFLVLGIFAVMSYCIIFPKTLKGRVIGCVTCFVSGFAVAGLTEILQLPIFTQGRHCSFSDVILDFSGYCASAVVLYLLVFIVQIAVTLINKKKY